MTTDEQPPTEADDAPSPADEQSPLLRQAFLLLVVFGLAWQVLVPAFHTPDEPNHIFRAYQLSEGRIWKADIGADYYQGNIESGRAYPSSFYDAMETSGFLRTRWVPTEKMNPADLRDAWVIRLSEGEPMHYGFPNTVVYPPVAYLPQTAVSFILRQIDGSVMLLVTTQRLVSFLLYLVLVWIGLRALPILKLPIILALLIPIAVQQSFAPGPDGLVGGCALIYAAYVLRYRLDDSRHVISNRELAVLTIVAVFMAVPKMTYFPLCWVSLTIPLARWGSRRRQLSALALLNGLPLAVVFLWLGSMVLNSSSMFANMFGGEAATAGPPGLSLLDTAALMVQNAWFNLTYLGFWEGFVGSLGWVDTRPPLALTVIWPIALLVAVLLQPTQGVRLTWRDSVIWGGVAVLTMAIMQFSVLRAVGSSPDYCIQGRYFLPLLPFVFVALHSLRCWLRPDQPARLHGRWVLLAATASLLTMTVVLKLRFFGA